MSEYVPMRGPLPGERYEPSNGSEGSAFLEFWCGRCARDKAMREGADLDECDDGGVSGRESAPVIRAREAYLRAHADHAAGRRAAPRSISEVARAYAIDLRSLRRALRRHGVPPR